MTTPTTLAEIGAAIREATCVTPDGELSEDSIAALDALNLSLHQKVEGYAFVGAEDRACAEALRKLAKTYENRAKAREAAADRRDEWLLHQMKLLGTDRIDTQTAKATIALNPPSLEVNDGVRVEDIDAEYLIVDRKLDKRKVLAAIKAGAQIAWARVVRGERLQWR